MKVSHRPSGNLILVWTVAVQTVLFGSGVYTTNDTKNCKLTSESPSGQKALSRLEPLTKQNFSTKATQGEENYIYVLQLCGDAGGIPGAAIVQLDTKDMAKKPIVLGSYNSSWAIGGSNWVMLVYKNSDKSSSDIGKAVVKISCDQTTDMGELKLIPEDGDKRQNSPYVFELNSSVVCPPLATHLSTGSILLIIFVCLLAVYLIGGFLYQRLIVGAKGMEQLPNYAFWVEVGNLTADGCDFVCRSQNREEAPTYRAIPTDALEEEPEERDDHLLPM